MKKRKIAIPVISVFLACVVTLAYLFYSGILLFKNPSASRYPIRGVDVSEYQGVIDWNAFKAQGIEFAFIKATEGSSYTDPYFRANFADAAKAGLRVGAYHFFSFDSAGVTQAEHFIGTVSKASGMLPPVIDVELYGKYKRHPPAKEAADAELNAFIGAVISAYGVDPILYATRRSYSLYIRGEFPACGIWIRNVLFRPSLPDGRAWTFWQYSGRGRLSGFSGREAHIDLDVFSGGASQFAAYGQ